MKVKYLSEFGYNELFDGISGNLSNYQTAEHPNWIFANFGERPFTKESRIDTNLPELYVNIENSDYVIIAVAFCFAPRPERPVLTHLSFL